MKKDANAVPSVLTEIHRGTRILVNGCGAVGISEATVDEFSPCGRYFKIGAKRWMAAKHEGRVVAILGMARRRRESL